MVSTAEKIPAIDLAKREGAECARIANKIHSLVESSAIEGLDPEALSQRFVDAHRIMNEERVAYCARLQSMSLKGGRIPEELLNTQEFFREMERKIDNQYRRFLLSKKAA